MSATVSAIVRQVIERSIAEGQCVGAIIAALRKCGRDPLVDLQSAIDTIRGWHDIQWAQVAVLSGLRPIGRESREPVIELLRQYVAELRASV